MKFKICSRLRTLEAIFLGFVFSCLESLKPVSEAGSRQILVQQNQWREHPRLLVPEHVTFITISSQASGTQAEHPRRTKGAARHTGILSRFCQNSILPFKAVKRAICVPAC